MLPRALVLSSGGPRGWCFLGCLDILYRFGILHEITMFAGTSIGAILGLLLCVGYTPHEIFVIGEYANFLPDMASFSLSTVKQGGLFSATALRERLTQLCRIKLDISPTFAQLPKQLTVTSYNCTTHQAMYLSRDTHPELSAVDACIMSASVPGFFTPYMWQQVDGTRHEMIDGAFGDPYPVACIPADVPAIGIYVETESIMPTSFFHRLDARISAPLKSLRNMAIQHCGPHVIHIQLVSPVMDAVGFRITHKQKLELYSNGQDTATTWISQHPELLFPAGISPNKEEQLPDNGKYLVVNTGWLPCLSKLRQ